VHPSFAWPLALIALLVVPLLLGAYLWQLRRRRRAAVRYSSVALIRSAMSPRSRWRRHLPVALFLAALVSLAFASARPKAAIDVPYSRTSVILALDVSGSMCSTDVRPNRLAVAQGAARAFVQKQPSGMRIGIVAFSEFAEILVPPTRDRKQLVAAIDGLTTSRGTAIGAAMLKAVDAIASVNPQVAPITANENYGVGTASPAAVPLTGYIPDIVVVLTDGRNTRGIDPAEAAKIVARRRVRVYTIGFGTTNPASLACTPDQLGGDPYAGGGFGGGGGFRGGGFQGRPGGFRSFLVADDAALKYVSHVTGGRFYKARDAGQLQKVFADLPRQVATQRKHVEISAGFVAVGALLAGTAMVLSLLWNRS
jgi:Ca-activated chloride channel family protein